MAEFTYKDILNDKQILQIYKDVDKKTNYVVSHGLIHMKHVVKHAKGLAKALKLSKEQEKLLLISAVLHDVGRNEDNETHHICGARFAKEYLSGKLESREIKVVADAIIYHSKEGSDFQAMDDVAWCLALADKLDFEKTRLIKSLLHQATSEKFNLYKETEKIKSSVKDGELVITITANSVNYEKTFARYKESARLFAPFSEHFGLKGYRFNCILAQNVV